MAKELASGESWTITQEGDKTFLQLKSVFGTIEVKTRTLIGAELIEAILQNYADLKKQGPLQATCAVCGLRAAYGNRCPGCRAFFCDNHYQVHLDDNAKMLASTGSEGGK